MLRKLGVIYFSTHGLLYLTWSFGDKDLICDKIITPWLNTWAPEMAHKFVISCLRRGIGPINYPQGDPILKTNLAHYPISSPIGLAAGFDKDAEALPGLSNLKFSFIEVGTVTPQPQSGYEGPRLFKLKKDKAIINRMGFNNEGADAMSERIDKFNEKYTKNFILGINLGKNKKSTDANLDYRTGVMKLGYCADYIVLNVSSPNTKGLRDLQNENELRSLLLNVKSEMKKRKVERPLFLKISPDLTTQGIEDIINVVREDETKVDGLIVANSTIRRDFDLHGPYFRLSGGLTGKPIRNLSTEMIREVYRISKGEIPIIGVGGVFTGDDAFEKIKAGASLIQFYSAFAYEGPTVLRKIESRLAQLLKENNFTNVSEAVGIDV